MMMGPSGCRRFCTCRIWGLSESRPPQGKNLALGYAALRHHQEERVSDALLKKVRTNDYVKVSISGATAVTPHVTYSLEVVDIYPTLPQIAEDPRFDGFRRDWLDIFQLNPRFRALANHAASDVCAFTVFEYRRWRSALRRSRPG